MTPERWRTVKELLAEALERDQCDRDALLSSRTDDPEVLAELRALLELGADVDRFLESPPPDPLLGALLGAYRIVSVIAHGGMGSVYRARREDGVFETDVAIKVLRFDLYTSDARRRFHRERTLLAHLRHPNIARLHDGGTTPDGRPYLVTEFVDGLPITRYCQSRAQPVSERIRLFLEVCAAVQYAHQMLVIHRDLKPSNILVQPDGSVKLLDFGIARFLGDNAEVLAQTATPPFTLRYASPEQIRGHSGTTGADIYSLGIVLQEIQTGVPPSADVHPPNGLSRELHAIIRKSTFPEPEERYSTVAELADDLRSFLTQRPLRAQPATALYRMRKFIQRHRTAVLAACTALAAPAVLFFETLRQKARAEEQYADLRRMSNSMIVEFQDELARIPGSLLLRRWMTKSALNLLEKMAMSRQDDPALKLDLLRAYEKVAGVQWSLGDHRESFKSLLTVERLYKEIPERYLTAELNSSQVETRRLIAVIHHTSGRESEAIRWQTRANELAQSSGLLKSSVRAAEAARSMAVYLAASGRLREAVSYAAEAVTPLLTDQSPLGPQAARCFAGDFVVAPRSSVGSSRRSGWSRP